MSLPRVLSLNSETELQMDVAPGTQQLRGAHMSITPETTPVTRWKIFDSFRVQDLAAELKIEIRPKADEFSLQLQSEAGKPFVTISSNSRSGSRELRVNNIRAPLPGTVGSPLDLHIFLDGSVLEVFVNKTISLTARIYEVPSGPLQLRREGGTEVVSFDAWQMIPISKDRLTGSLCSQRVVNHFGGS